MAKTDICAFISYFPHPDPEQFLIRFAKRPSKMKQVLKNFISYCCIRHKFPLHAIIKEREIKSMLLQTILSLGIVGKRHAVFAALAALSIAVTACADDAEADENTAEKTEKAAVAVTVAPVQSVTANQILELTGTVRYLLETPLAFTSTGKIATIRYDSGQRVAKGALMAALDTTSVDADLAAAQAELERSTSELARLETLFDQGWVTRPQLDQAQAAQKSAAAQVSARQFATRTSRIYAPSSGIILSREAEPGQVLQAGAPVLFMGEASGGLVLRTPATDREVAQLTIGMTADIYIGALNDEPIKAQIRDIDGRADPGTGTFALTFALPNDRKLRSGQIGEARIALAPNSDDPILSIPAPAVFDIRTGEALVYVVNPKDNMVAARSVRLGKLLDDRITIISGLERGEQIVVTGHEEIRPGDIVAPRKIQQTGRTISGKAKEGKAQTLGERAAQQPANAANAQ
jgi:membrane fusion protein (multidrug efflux system)